MWGSLFPLNSQLGRLPNSRRISLFGYALRVVIPLGIVIFSFMWSGGSYYLKNYVENELRQHVATIGVREAQRIQNQLEGLKNFARTLAGNDLLINGLIDLDSNSSYLPAFFYSLYPPVSSKGQVFLVDYKGRILISNRNSDPLSTVAPGKETISINQNSLTIRVPILYSGSIEGGVVLRYSASTYDKLFGGSVAGYDFFLYSDDNQVVYSTNSKLAETGQPAPSSDIDEWVQVRTHLANDNLSVSAASSISVAFETLKTLEFILFIGFATLLAVLVALLIISLVIVSKPLKNLAHNISKIRDANDLDRILNIEGPREISEVASAFNQMTDTLKSTIVSKNELIVLAETESKLKEAAEAANLAKSNFLATMSHEIRTPLNGVLGLTQLLTHSDLNKDQRKKVETILSSGQTLLAIINDVLDMSRIEAGGVELENNAFNLRNLISVISSPFQNLADEKGLHLRVSDQVAASLTLKGDPVRLRQVIWNLLSNAIKITAAGSVSLIITELEPEGGQPGPMKRKIQFHIEDTGAGISSDRLKEIFDPFTQADSSITRKHGGTGLGLAIVNQLTELMGGTIEVKSEINKGTQFNVTLCFDEASEQESDRLLESPVAEFNQAIPPMNVLVAEDNDINAMIASAFLRKFGHGVRVVENGKLAVNAAAEGWADMILMDIHMPEMNGMDATKIIRASETGKSIPIIGLTAEAFAERHTVFIESGMNDVLTKPYTEPQLLKTLSSGAILLGSGARNFKHSNPPADASQPQVRNPSDIRQSSADQASMALEVSEVGNNHALDNLQKQLGPDLVADLLGKAVETLRSQVVLLHAALGQQDTSAIQSVAHSIKGASGSMGATKIVTLAAKIETARDDPQQLQNLIIELDPTADATIHWWRNRDSERPNKQT